MDFFDAQDHARRLSHRLILLYGAAVLSMVVIVYFTGLFVLVMDPVPLFTGGPVSPDWGREIFHPPLFLAVTVGMGMIIGPGALFRTAQLRKGGSAVAELLGGRRVDPSSTDPKERVLVNVVEEMSIASGLPVPAIYVMDREAGINAFAAGHTLDDAAVAVTRGTLESLTRDELQGVVAHEFSHILNGDMRLNVRLMGLLFGILLLAILGRGLLRGSMWGGGRSGSGGRRSSGGQIAIMGLVLVALGYLGVFFGRVIQAAVSRQREFLADAAAVQFTRNPGGIAGALKRIGAMGGAGKEGRRKGRAGSRIQNHHAEEASHLFFADGVGKALSGLTATHPPLAERIRRVDPRWDGSWEVPPVRATGGDRVRSGERGRSGEGRPPGGITPGGTVGRAGLAGLAGEAPEGGEGPRKSEGKVQGGTSRRGRSLVASAGLPGPGHVQYARRILEAVPDTLRVAVREPEGAVAVLVALVLPIGHPSEAGVRERVGGRLGRETIRRAVELAPAVARVGAEGRLPLVELAVPQLRHLPGERASALRSAVQEAIRADGEIRTFDFALFHILQQNLPGARVSGRGRGLSARTPLSRLGGEARLLLSAVAQSASGGEESLERAFRLGTDRLAGEGLDEAREWTLHRPGTLDLVQVDDALARMEQGSPTARKALLTAAELIIRADGEVEAEEAEMFRALAEALQVPVPPLLPGDLAPGAPPDPEPADASGAG